MRLDAALPIYVETWNGQLEFKRFPARMATLTLGVMGALSADPLILLREE